MNAFVSIRIEGKRAERLLEQMRRTAIPIYALHRVSDFAVEAIIPAKDFKRLHAISARNGCKIHIVQRLGSFFMFRNLFRRYALWGSGLCILVLMMLASVRILWIDIEGCSKIAEKTILRALSEEGIRVGSSTKDLNFPGLNDRIRVYDDRIAWVGLSLDGSVLRVRIVESIPTTDETDAEMPVDIVAQKDGRITRMEADAGRAAVAVGDHVVAGDLLISGDLTTEESQYPVYAHAAGRVYAQVAYVGEAVAEAEKTEYADSGNSMPYREVQICGRSLFTTAIPYTNYVLRDCSTSAVSDLLLPICLFEGTCYEQTLQTIRQSKEEMTEAALYEAEQSAYLKIPKDAVITEKHAAWIETEGRILGIVTVLTEESIGLAKESDIGNNRNFDEPDSRED